MRVRVKLFAALRESIGESDLPVELPDNASVSVLIQQLCQQDQKWQPLTEVMVLIAVNQEIASLDTLLQTEDEVAFFPPVTGG